MDNIQTCEGWRQLHDVSAEEGLISIAFERKYGQWRYISSDYVYHKATSREVASV